MDGKSLLSFFSFNYRKEFLTPKQLVHISAMVKLEFEKRSLSDGEIWND